VCTRPRVSAQLLMLLLLLDSGDGHSAA